MKHPILFYSNENSSVYMKKGCLCGVCVQGMKMKNSVDFSLAEKQSIKSCPGIWLHKHTHLYTSHTNMSSAQGPVGTWLSFPISHYVPYRMLYLQKAFQQITLGAWTCNSASLSLLLVLLCSSLSPSLLHPWASSAFFSPSNTAVAFLSYLSYSFFLKMLTSLLPHAHTGPGFDIFRTWPAFLPCTELFW